MTHSSAIKSLLSYLLVISFLLTPISTALAVLEGSGGSGFSSTPAPGTNNGGFAGSEDEDEEDDSDEESEEERDRRLAEETKAEIDSAIAAAGLNLEVGAVYGSSPSGSSVSVAGVSIGKEEALAAISAMGAALNVGAFGVVEVSKTLAAYADGSVCAGCVVGFNTATVGTPTEVAKAEADYVISIAGVVGARLVSNGLGNAVAIKANDLSSAISSVAQKLLPTNNSSTVIPPSVISQYQEMGRGLQSAGVSNLGGTQIEKGYVYSSETGGLVGITTGKIYEVSNVGLASNVPQIAAANPNATVKIDTTNGLISATDATTGIVQSYNLEGAALIPNYDIEAAFTWDGTDYGQFFLIDDNNGKLQVLDATGGTPSSWVATGDFDLGVVPASLQTLAIQYGYTIDSPAELVALALSGELSHETRRAIVEAYEEDPTFATLDLSDISEVGGILGAFAGQAYLTDKTLAEQLLVDRYVTSITWDPYHENESAFDRYKNDGEAMLALAEAYTSGQLTDKYGLKITAPVEVANHTYASTYDPDNPNAKPLTAGNAWITEVNENAIRVGGRFYTEIGYISSELNNSSNWRGLMVDQDFNYDETVYGEYAQDIYTMVTSVPTTNLGVVNLGNDSDINISDLFSGPYSPGTGFSSVNNNQPNTQDPTDTSFQPVSTTPAPSSGCADCVVIESAVCKIPGSCTIDSDYAVRLDYLVENSDLPFRVTEGYPPTVNHTNPCHSNGTCTDIGFTGITYTSETVNQFIEDAEKAGLRAVFESVTEAGCAGIENCQVIPWATASHFSLYMGEGTPDYTSSNGSTVAAPSNTSPFGQLGNILTDGLDAALGAAEDVLGNEALDELNRAMDNPLFGVYLWAVNTFGVGSGGTLNTDLNNNSGSDSTKNIPPCPLNPADPDPYRELRIQNGYPSCTATSTPNNQAGAAFLPLLDSDFVQYILNIFGWRKSEDNPSTINVSPITETDTALVKITIDDSNKVVALSRPDLEALIADESIDATERTMLLEKLKETPVIFDETGAMIYSNGIYTPPIENGREIASSQTYSYVIEYVDANGNVIPTNTTNVSDNIITDALRSLLGENKPFTINSVENITYYLTDPDSSIPNDEYYLYTVTTMDGRSRTIDIPHFSTVSLMNERFQKIGYSGDVLALTALATEKEPETRTFDKVADFVTDLLGKFVDALNSPSSTLEDGTNTVLPEISGELNASDIKNINIYPNSTLACPNLPELSQGFMYTVALTDRANPQKYINITDGRCGSTDPLMMVAETARHLQVHYGIPEVTYDSIADKTTFHTEVTAFIPGVTSKIIGGSSEPEDVTPTLPDDPDVTSSSTPTQLPNLTNTIIFEVKAVGSDGKILADWVDSEEITISSDVQLYFRWNGNDYQQCLPFLNDNGNYSLTRSNRAMITGDTEAESYGITERTGTYRVECGGQRNNEFGVDFREVEVTVQ